MAEGMAQVQQGAVAVFTLILADDIRLDLTGAADGMDQRLGAAGEQPVDIDLQPVKEGGIVDQAVLDDLGKARAQFARRQRGQSIGIGDAPPRADGRHR